MNKAVDIDYPTVFPLESGCWNLGSTVIDGKRFYVTVNKLGNQDKPWAIFAHGLTETYVLSPSGFVLKGAILFTYIDWRSAVAAFRELA